jgi:hypothetical protein
MTKTAALVSTCSFLVGGILFVACGGDDPPVQVGGTGGTGGTGGEGGAGGDVGGTKLISSSTQSDYESDPRIAQASDGTLVAAWTGFNEGLPTHVGYAFSTNDGGTWSEPQTLSSSDGFSYSSPDLVADVFGNIHLSFLASSRSGQGGNVYVARATGESFGDPIAVTDEEVVGFYGRPRIALTNSGSLVIAYTQIVNGRAQVIVAESGDGELWTPLALSGNNTDHFFPYPCSALDTSMGRTYVVYVVDGRLVLQSTDNGQDWSGGVEIQGAGEAGSVGLPPTCFAQGDDLWVSYGLRTASYLHAVRVAHSPDGGATFDSHASVHDALVAPYFTNHQIAVEPSGAANVVFYAASGPGDQVGSFRRVRYSPAEVGGGGAGGMGTGGMGGEGGIADPGMESTLVHEPIRFELSSESVSWLGSGVGLLYDNNDLFVAYVENAERDAHIAFEKITVP